MHGTIFEREKNLPRQNIRTEVRLDETGVEFDADKID